jgi:hypothetical protein
MPNSTYLPTLSLYTRTKLRSLNVAPSQGVIVASMCEVGWSEDEERARHSVRRNMKHHAKRNPPLPSLKPRKREHVRRTSPHIIVTHTPASSQLHSRQYRSRPNRSWTNCKFRAPPSAGVSIDANCSLCTGPTAVEEQARRRGGRSMRHYSRSSSRIGRHRARRQTRRTTTSRGGRRLEICARVPRSRRRNRRRRRPCPRPRRPPRGEHRHDDDSRRWRHRANYRSSPIPPAACP